MRRLLLVAAVVLAVPPGGAAALRRRAPLGFRYQYLAGGVNTGNGWATWNDNGTFVTRYVDESVKAHITPGTSALKSTML